MLIVSLYCRPNGRVNECLEYLDNVLSVASEKRVLIGMDANSSSDMWFSKNILRDRLNQRRGVTFSD